MPSFDEPISGMLTVLSEHIAMGVVPMILVALGLLVHVAFMVAVFGDAIGRRKGAQTVWFVHPVIWGLAALFGGVVTAAIYWAMHYSTLASSKGD